MQKASGAESPEAGPQSAPLRWTRTGFVAEPLALGPPLETMESLVFSTEMGARIQSMAVSFLSSRDIQERAGVPWSRGAFLFGPAGCGKTAATRALALGIGVAHITIPAHELLDSFHLTRALADAANRSPAVVVLDHIDEVLKRVDAPAFLAELDAILARAGGVYWVATTSRPEEVPKNQLVRPGRFEEAIRFGTPDEATKNRYFETYLAPLLKAAFGGEESALTLVRARSLAILGENPGVSFANLEEARKLLVRVLADGHTEQVAEELEIFLRSLLIDADRFGGPGAQTQEIQDRVKAADPRLLVSALQISDAVKRIVDMSVASTAETLQRTEPEPGG